MTIVGLSVVAITLVTSMVVAILVAMMLPVACFMAACNGKMSHLLLFWLLFVLGNLLKNAGLFVGRLTLLKKSNELERVRGHRLVCIRKLKLMRLGLRKEDLFALLLRHGHFHCSLELATVKVAEELHSMPHELVHWHGGRLFGSTRPAYQLVADIGEPGNCLKVIPDALIKVTFVQSASVGHCLAMTFVHSVRPTS
jgi:hypothetical protein